MGDKYLCKLLVVGATALIRRARHKPEAADPRLADQLTRSQCGWQRSPWPTRMARIAWAIMTTLPSRRTRDPAGSYMAPTAIGHEAGLIMAKYEPE